MAVYRDIDSDVRINGSLLLPTGSLTVNGINIINAISGKVDNTISISSGTGLSGGGSLSSSRTLSVVFGTAAGTVAEGDHGHGMGDVAGLDTALTGKSNTGHLHTFGELTNKPTTLSGYGITDAADKSHTHSFSSLTSRPTTLLGYGITDAATASHHHNTVYLGISATAADAGKLGGQLPSYYATASAVNGHLNNAAIHKDWGNWDTSASSLRVNNFVFATHNTTTNKLFLNPNKSFASLDITGGATVDGNAIWHSGNLSKTDFITATDPASVVAGFTVKGRTWIGDAANAGSIMVKDGAGQNTIHIGGATTDSNSRAWIADTGYAWFKNTVRVSNLQIDTNSQITNLNAEFLNGFKSDAFVRAISIVDVAGIGVSHGFRVTAQNPVSNSIVIEAGLAITDSGKRTEKTQPLTMGMSEANTSYARIDLIFIQGSKTKDTNGSFIPTGVNEGEPRIQIGIATTGSPVAPYAAMYDEYPDAIPLAEILRPANVQDIESTRITDVRKFAGITTPKNATVEVGRPLNVSARVTAPQFKGSGAELTSLPVNQFGSSRIAKANLDSQIMYLNAAETIAANKTFSATANLYFAGGTSYYINTAGTGRLNSLHTTGILSVEGMNYLSFGSSGVGTPTGTAGLKIDLYDQRYSIGVDTSMVWYNSVGSHNFYSGGTVLQGAVSNTGITSEKDVVVKRNLEVYGEVKIGAPNEFPDPMVASRFTNYWNSPVNSTLVFEATQAPSGLGAAGSLKLTASAGDAYVYGATYFEVKPQEAITFSLYGFSTTSGKTAQIYISWHDAAGAMVSTSSNTFAMGTAWTRYRVTGKAHASATQFRVRIDNDGGAGSIMYFSAFQVERGEALTPFKGYTGSGKEASLIGNHLRLGPSGEIHSSFNNGLILKDHGNGNVSLSAAGTDLYLGYTQTTNLMLSANLSLPSGLKVADTTGKLYYQGNDIDARYLKLTGGTVTGATTFSGTLNATGGGYYTGTHIFNTSLGAAPVVISRSNGTTEALHIGVSDNVATFDYKNDEVASTMVFSIADASGSYTGLAIDSNGTGVKVGVGKSSPTEALDVAGNITASGNLNVAGDITFNDGMLIASNLTTTNIDHIWHDESGAGSNSTVGTWNFASDATAKAVGNSGLRFGSFYAAGTEQSYIAGALGIGTNTVSAKLTVDGDISATTGISTNGNFVTNGGMLEINAPVTTSGWARGMNMNSSDGATRHAGIGMLGSSTSSTLLYMAYGSSAHSSGLGLYVQPNGNVSIGQANSSDKLHIAVPTTGTAMTGTAAYGGIHLDQLGGDNNYVGITASSSGTKGTQAGVLFQGSGSYGTKIHFMTTSSHASGQSNRMTLDSGGNLGIGTTAPSSKLHVVGTGAFTGTLTASALTTSGNQTATAGDIVISGSNKGVQFSAGGRIFQNSTTDTWIRMDKPLYMSENIRTDATLQVGSSNGLDVTATTFNWKGSTLFSNTAGKVSINKSSNSEHPLHVTSDGSYMGVNVQSTADTDISGFSFQRSNNYYNWNIATSSGAASDLVFFGGNSTSMSVLAERVRMKNGGGVVIQSVGTIGLGTAANGALVIEDGASKLAMDANELFFTGTGDNYIGTIGTGDLSFYLGGTSRVRFNNNGTTHFTGSMTVNSTVGMTSAVISSGNGLGVRYWSSSSYSTYMSTSADATYGGKLSWIADDDYNMYFKMGSNNRGFAFSNPTQGGVNAQIEGNGRVNSKVGFRADKFEMAYNATEDSLDFIYHG